MSDIGIGLSRTLEVFRSHGLTPYREALPSAVFKEVWPVKVRPRTTLTPEVVFWLMAWVALGEGTMSAAVASFWSTLPAFGFPMGAGPVTEEAFCMARRALSKEFFAALFRTVVCRFDATFGGRFRWRGFRLLGIDGTTVNLPPAKALRKAFPPPSNKNGECARPQGLLVGLVGLWTGICHAFLWVPLRRSEQFCACFLARYLRPNDLLLADCNFSSYEIIQTVRRSGAHILMRLSSAPYRSAVLRMTPSGRSDEGYLDVSIPKAVRRKHPHMATTMTLRIIHYQIRGYRPSRIITSLLDTTLYPRDDLVALYHERWHQETRHAEWKHTLQLNNLRSHTPQGILKELHVQLTLNNLTRWIMALAVKGDLRPVDLKFRACKRLITSVVHVMQTAEVRRLPAIFRDLLATLYEEQILKRPGRSYPRPSDRVRNKGKGKTRAPARLVA
jgi:hypothetical protein